MAATAFDPYYLYKTSFYSKTKLLVKHMKHKQPTQVEGVRQTPVIPFYHQHCVNICRTGISKRLKSVCPISICEVAWNLYDNLCRDVS